MGSASPAERTLRRLRDAGWTAQVVERWNAHARRRVDLFNCIDILAVHPDGPCIMGVQATTRPNVPARVNKILATPQAEAWVRSGGLLHVWGWYRTKLLTDGRWWFYRSVMLVWDAEAGELRAADTSEGVET